MFEQGKSGSFTTRGTKCPEDYCQLRSTLLGLSYRTGHERHLNSFRVCEQNCESCASVITISVRPNKHVLFPLSIPDSYIHKFGLIISYCNAADTENAVTAGRMYVYGSNFSAGETVLKRETLNAIFCDRSSAHMA